MSEHKAYERAVKAHFDGELTAKDVEPRGRFRVDPATGDDIALSAYRHFEREWYWQPNARNPRTGRPMPRINHAKRALRAAQPKGTAL